MSDDGIAQRKNNLDERELTIRTLLRERDEAMDQVTDLIDCKEHLRKLGAYCGCDHVDSADERMQQRHHIEEWIRRTDERCRELSGSLDMLRALLEQATDAWDHCEIEGHLWRSVTLSRAWREAARVALEGKGAGT